jgi:hypothetical protein
MTSLYRKWHGTLNTQMADAYRQCSVMSVDCINDIEAVMAILGDIRADVSHEPAGSGDYAGLLAALDKADEDHARFTRMNCASGGDETNCVLQVSGIGQDVTNVVNQLER